MPTHGTPKSQIQDESQTQGVDFPKQWLWICQMNAGPQFGLYLSDSQKTNFSVEHMPATDNNRVSPVVAQDTMAVKNKLDYGIALGLGAEYSIPKVGHFLAEARYYYGLGNIYGASKRDYFGKSNYGQIVLKLSYLFDITRTKNVKRK